MLKQVHEYSYMQTNYNNHEIFANIILLRDVVHINIFVYTFIQTKFV